MSFALSKHGFGSFLEIYNDWTLDDYQECMKFLVETRVQDGEWNRRDSIKS